MTRKNNNPPQNGPSSELISRINHLGNLLKNLPKSLPLNPHDPESSYNFGLDMEMVEEEGVWYAFNRNLEVCFETHKIAPGGTIIFRERGVRKDADREFLRETWFQ